MKKLFMALVTSFALVFGVANAQEPTTVPILNAVVPRCPEDPVTPTYDVVFVNETLTTTYETLFEQTEARFGEVFGLGIEVSSEYHNLLGRLDQRGLTPDNTPDSIVKLVEAAGNLLADSQDNFGVCMVFYSLAGINGTDAENFSGDVANIAYAMGITNLCRAVERAKLVEASLLDAQNAVELATSLLPDPEA